MTRSSGARFKRKFKEWWEEADRLYTLNAAAVKPAQGSLFRPEVRESVFRCKRPRHVCVCGHVTVCVLVVVLAVKLVVRIVVLCNTQRQGMFSDAQRAANNRTSGRIVLIKERFLGKGFLSSGRS
jgi:hypothetical protein